MQVAVDGLLELVAYLKELSTGHSRLARSALHIQLMLAKGIGMFHMAKRYDFQFNLLGGKIPKTYHLLNHHSTTAFVV